MKKLWLALVFAILSGLAPARAQVVPPNAAATPVVSAAAEGSHVLKASPGNLYALYVVDTGAVAGFIMVFNATTAPANGAVTPIHCVPVSASGYNFLNFAPQPPEFYSIGIVAVYSSTGCFTKTTSATAFFHAIVQ